MYDLGNDLDKNCENLIFKTNMIDSMTYNSGWHWSVHNVLDCMVRGQDQNTRMSVTVAHLVCKFTFISK